MVVLQDLGATAKQGVADLTGAGPVVVVTENGHDRSRELAHQRGQLVQVELAVADKIAGYDHEVRSFGVGQRDRVSLDAVRRHTADVQVGEVDDPEMRERSDVGGGACKSSDPDTRIPEPLVAVGRQNPPGAQQCHVCVRV